MPSRKELKEAYKQQKAPMGVFAIRNLTNDKVLIDHSTNMQSKWNRHRTELKFGSHRNRALQRDWKDLGEQQFVFEILSELKEDKDQTMNYKAELKTLQEMVLEEHPTLQSYN